jgi:hypothetical protein
MQPNPFISKEETLKIISKATKKALLDGKDDVRKVVAKYLGKDVPELILSGKATWCMDDFGNVYVKPNE